MNKGLEALKWLIDNGYIKYEKSWQEAPYILESINTIEKELKASEIIKEKTQIELFEERDSEECAHGAVQYWLNIGSFSGPISREKYDLLKEDLE